MIKVFTLTRPQVDFAAIEAFLLCEGAEWHRTPGASPADEIVEVAGRTCYMSFGAKQSPRNNADYIQNLINQEHGSVLEHVNWTFALTGVSRAFTHQFVRHRVGFAFSQLSQQYHDESDAAFVEPEGVSQFPEVLQAWRASVESARESYKNILKTLRDHEVQSDLVKKEQLRYIRSAARSVFPNATKTTIVVTANARALRYFLSVRGAIIGDPEMRLVSAALLDELKKDTEALFADFRKKMMPDGLPLVHHEPLQRKS